VNPYELINKNVSCINWIEEASDMLRQQADRIAELEKDLHMALRHYDQLAHDLVLNPTPQIKEISDEQIFKLAEMLELKVSHALYAFARTLIKNSQEEKHETNQ